MTLCVAFVSPSFAGCVSDRRLTSSAGRLIVSEEADKSGTVAFRDSLLTYSFSGLAEAGGRGRFRFNMARWLAEAICDSGSPGVGAVEALEVLAKLCTEKFKSLVVEQKYKATTIVLSGYVDGVNGDQVGLIAVVSNFEGLLGDFASEVEDSFRLDYQEIDLTSAGIRQIGSGRIHESDARDIADLLCKGIAPEHAIRRAVAAIRAAAERTKDRSVGKRCTSIYVARGFKEAAVVDYHSDSVSYDMFYPACVSAKYDEEGAYVMVGARASGFDSTGTAQASRVEVVRRNQQCPCKSGKKYKFCHGGPGRSEFGPGGANSVKSEFYLMVKQFGTVEVTLESLWSDSKRRLPRRRLTEPAPEGT